MSTSRFGIFTVLYALLIAYASTIVGPLGLHFVPLPLQEALHRLVSVVYIQHGSDQRADWMGNVLMLIPLGFLLTGWVSGERRQSPTAAIGAFIGAMGFVLIVKFAQLYFPPRTVTLNYILAQGLGVAIGIALFVAPRRGLAELGRGHDRMATARAMLLLYTAALVLFLLMPLDFALTQEDLLAQLQKLPDTLIAVGGEGRPFVVRIVLILASIAAMMPVGALLTFEAGGRAFVGRSTGAATLLGFCAMAGLYALTTLLIGGAPALLAVFYRTIGIAAGAWLMRWITRQDPDAIRAALAGTLPRLAPVYLAVLFAVNGLISLDWIGPGEAAEAINPRSLIPLYNYYIVAKAQAAKNIAGHAAMFVPIGVMVWLAVREGGTVMAFILGGVLSAVVEALRFLRPGLVPDINAIPLAAAAAWAAAALMPVLWRVVESISVIRPVSVQTLHPAAAAGWRDRAEDRHARRRNRGTPIGEVEDY